MARQVGMPNARPLSGPQTQMSTALLQQNQQAAQTMSAVGDSMVRIGAKIRSERDYINAKTDHLKISEYIINQQIEHSKLSPSDQLSQSEAYRGKVKKFIDDTVTGASSEQARGMLKGPAQQSLLGYKQWSLTQELKAQQAQELAVIVASGDNAAVAASVAAAQPEGDPLALAAADEMPSDDPNIDTGMSISAQHAENAANSQDPKKPPRTNFEVQRDSAFSNYDDEADQRFGESGSPKLREAFIRDKKTDFYDKVVSTLLAQDPPMFKKAKQLMESIPATEINPKKKGTLMGQIKRAATQQKATDDNNKALSLTFDVLDKAGVGNLDPPGSSSHLASEQIDRAGQSLERLFRSGEITASVYNPARQHLNNEGGDLVARQADQANQLIAEITANHPNALKLDDLPPELQQALAQNPIAFNKVVGRQAAANDKAVAGALASLSPAGDAPKSLFDSRNHYLERTVASVRKRKLSVEHGSVLRDHRRLFSIFEEHPELRKGLSPESKNKPWRELSQQEVEYAIQTYFFPLGKEGDELSAVDEVLDVYRASINSFTLSDPQFDVAAKNAIKEALQPSPDQTNIFGKIESDKSSGGLIRGAEIAPHVMRRGVLFLRRHFANDDKIAGLNMVQMSEIISKEISSSPYFFDLTSNGEMDEGDVPIPAFALSSNLRMSNFDEGRIAIEVDGKLIPIGQYGEGFLKAFQKSVNNKLDASEKKEGSNRDVMSYKLLQQQEDILSFSPIDFSLRRHETEDDFFKFQKDIKRAGADMKLLNNFVDPDQNWDPIVVESLRPSVGEERITGEALDNADAYLVREAGSDPKKLEQLRSDLGRYASAFSYQKRIHSPEVLDDVSAGLYQGLLKLEEKIRDDQVRIKATVDQDQLRLLDTATWRDSGQVNTLMNELRKNYNLRTRQDIQALATESPLSSGHWWSALGQSLMTAGEQFALSSRGIESKGLDELKFRKWLKNLGDK